MRKIKFFKKYPKTGLILINIALFLGMLAIAELLLNLFTPFNVATIGHQFSENSKRYGWGYNPHDPIRILDPDTGHTYFSYANNHGWRDMDRQYENEKGAFRILVLGDSVTFGAIVPDNKIYTRILEDKLCQAGYNIEVISIAYGGWGTDQELEALVNEGLKYNPNLIIVQFTNDVMRNSYFYHATKDEKKRGGLINWKPFYYELDQNNNLKRNLNPHFRKSNDYLTKVKDFMLHFEIFKHLYAEYIKYSHRKTNYRVTDNQLLQLQIVINLNPDMFLYKFLREHKGRSLTPPALHAAIRLSGYQTQQDTIQRILEDRWFQQYWSNNDYVPEPVNEKSYDWQLYFALISEIKRQANTIGADLAVFPETEDGSYEWSVSWYRVKNDKLSKANYLSYLRVMRSILHQQCIDIIDNIRPYKRARNDPHPNIEGNQAMADDIWQYLMLHKKDELARYRNLTGESHSSCIAREGKD